MKRLALLVVLMLLVSVAFAQMAPRVIVSNKWVGTAFASDSVWLKGSSTGAVYNLTLAHDSGTALLYVAAENDTASGRYWILYPGDTYTLPTSARWLRTCASADTVKRRILVPR